MILNDCMIPNVKKTIRHKKTRIRNLVIAHY